MPLWNLDAEETGCCGRTGRSCGFHLWTWTAGRHQISVQNGECTISTFTLCSACFDVNRIDFRQERTSVINTLLFNIISFMNIYIYLIVNLKTRIIHRMRDLYVHIYIYNVYIMYI